MLKYIIFEDNAGLPHFRIWEPWGASHAEMKANAPVGWAVVGAGLLSMNGDSVGCVSQSASLNRPFSQPNSMSDSEAFRRMFKTSV